MGYDSMQLSDQIELLGGGVASTIPECAGATFRLAPGWDLDAPHPTAAYVVSLILDGERPEGRRASNRTPTLPIVIQAPDRNTLAAAREVLMRAVDAETFTLRILRDGSALPFVLDCFRANAAVVNYSLPYEHSLVSALAISFSALPYGRADVPSVIDFPTPLVGKVAPSSPVTIDSFSTVTGTHWSQSLQGPGPFSAYYSTGGTGVGITASYTRSSIGPLNLTGMQGLTVYAGFGSTGNFPWWGLRGRAKGPVTFTFTLTDGAKSASVHVTRGVLASNRSEVPVWQKIRVPIPSGGGLNLAAITGYTVKVANRASGDLQYTDLYLDSLTAVPWVTNQAANPNTGTVIDLAGIAGSARSPFSIQCTQPSGTALQTTKVWSTPGTFSWLAPAGCTVVQRTEPYGTGGHGSNDGTAGKRAGAGGGAYSGEPGLPVTPGNTYQVVVGRGGNTTAGSGGNSSFTADGGVTVTAQGAPNLGLNVNTAGTGATASTPIAQLTGNASTFDSGLSNWAASTNCTVTQVTAQHRTGAGSMQMSSSAAGDMQAGSCSASNILTQGRPCDPLFPVTVNGFAKAQTTPRSSSLGADFYDATGTLTGSLFGADTSTVTTGFTAMAAATLTPPSGSVWCRAKTKVKATAAAGEITWFDDVTMTTGVSYAGGSGGPGAGGAGAGGGGGAGPSGAGGAGSGSGAFGANGGGLSGHGGAGGSSTGIPGSDGNRAGGGGGGAWGGLFPTAGGNGGDGKVALTFTQTAGFKTLVLHKPGFSAPDTLCPFVPVSVNDIPDGTTEYQVPTLVSGQPARFGSTYSIVAVANSWNNPTANRVVTVQVNHYEQSGGVLYQSPPAQRTVQPSLLSSNMCNLGELTIPDHLLPDDNTNSFFTITVQSSNTADRFQDVLFLDTQGTSIIIQSPTAYVSYWIDEPAGAAPIGNVLGSMFDRPDAVSVLAYTDFSGPPLNVDPLGNQALLLYSADGVAPAAELTHSPRWMLERLA